MTRSEILEAKKKKKSTGAENNIQQANKAENSSITKQKKLCQRKWQNVKESKRLMEMAECERIEKTDGTYSIFYNELMNYANRLIQREDRCRVHGSDDYDMIFTLDPISSKLFVPPTNKGSV